MPHFDYTVNLGTILHLVSLLLGGVIMYAKLVARQEKIETHFVDIVRRLDIVEKALTNNSIALEGWIGRTEHLLSDKRQR